MESQALALVGIVWIIAILGTPLWVFLAGRHVTRLRVRLESPHRSPGHVREVTSPPVASEDRESMLVESPLREPVLATRHSR